MSSNYFVHWYNHTGTTRKGILTAFNRLEYVRAENKVGTLVMTLPRELLDFDDFQVGDMFEIFCERGGAPTLENATAYFLQDWQFFADESGEEFIDLLAYDAMWLLDTAIISDDADSTYTNVTDYPDDMMKAIVRRYLGPDYVIDASQYKMEVDPDYSRGGSTITKEFAWRNVLSVLQEIADQAFENGVYLVFDVKRDAVGEFRFRTFIGQRGQDHGITSDDPRLVGRQYGNLAQARFGEFHSQERNSALVGGQGEGEERITASVDVDEFIKASKWNRREIFVDARDFELTDSLEAEGKAALIEYRPRRVLEGTLKDTPGMRFRVHYNWGDIVAVEAFGYHLDCHVTAVRVVVDQENGEQVEVKLRGETYEI